MKVKLGIAKLVLNLGFSCLSLPSAGIIDIYHHTPPHTSIEAFK
jgi:hypothetical protein